MFFNLFTVFNPSQESPESYDWKAKIKNLLSFYCYMYLAIILSALFFAQAPQLHPKASQITGVICGYRVEDIEHSLMQKICYLDKLIDELAKGKLWKRF